MKNNFIVFLFLIMLMPLLADELTVGNGTSATGGIPITTSYDYSWCRMLYTESEIGSMGDCYIEQIALNLWYDSSEIVANSQMIYMKSCVESAIPDRYYPDPANNGYYLCFSGTVIINQSGWLTITLDTPFHYSGVGGIDIVYENHDGSASSTSPYFYYTFYSTYRTSYGYANGAFPTSYRNWSTRLPNMRFTYGPGFDPPGCATVLYPENSATDILLSQQLSWEAAEGEIDGYNFSLGTDNPPTNILLMCDIGDQLSYQLTDELDYSQTYYWQITPYNLAGNAEGCPVWSFSTLTPPQPATIDSPTDGSNDISVYQSLDWTHGDGIIDGYRISIGTDNPPTNICNMENLGDVTTYAPDSPWDYAQAYYWKITPYNEAGDADSCPIWSFTTENAPVIDTFPYSNGFNGQPFPPEGWDWGYLTWFERYLEQYATGANPYVTPYEGTHMVGMDSYNNYYNAYLTTPQIMMQPGYIYTASVWVYRDAGYPDADDVLYIDRNTTQEYEYVTDIGRVYRATQREPQEETEGWHRYAFDFEVENAGTQYIFLRCIASYYQQGNNMFFDDFTIDRRNGSFPVTESFDTASIPEGWTQTNQGGITSNRWSISETNFAGDEANEMMAEYMEGTGISRLISPALFTGDMDRFAVVFSSDYWDYDTGVTAKIQYSHDLATWYDTSWYWEGGWGDYVNTDIVQIPVQDNAEYTYIAWTLDGNHYSFDYWFVDDVEFCQMEYDVEAYSIDIQEAVPGGDLIPRATVINNGDHTESFEVNFYIDEELWDSQMVADLPPQQTQELEFSAIPMEENFIYDWTLEVYMDSDQVEANDFLDSYSVCLPLDVTAYADIAYDPNGILSGLCSFSLQDPQTLSVLPFTPLNTNFLPGGDWVDGKWLASEYSTNTLWEIVPDLETMTSLGVSSTYLNGIAWDVNHEILYGATSTELYQVDPLTGALTLIGSFQDENLVMIGIAFDSWSDVLYGVDLTYSALFSIDTATGEAIPVGELGYYLNYAQDLAFDTENGYMYLSGYAWNGVEYAGTLFWIDTYSGYAYKIEDIQSDCELTAFAIPFDSVSAPVVSISGPGSLSWVPIENISSYKVFSAEHPEDEFTFREQVTDNYWQDPSPADEMGYYFVTSVNGSILRRQQNELTQSLSERNRKIDKREEKISEFRKKHHRKTSRFNVIHASHFVENRGDSHTGLGVVSSTSAPPPFASGRRPALRRR